MNKFKEKPLSESPIGALPTSDFVLDIDVLSGMSVSHRIDVGLHSSISIAARVHANASLSIFVIGDVASDCVIDRAISVIGDSASIELSSSIRTKGNTRCAISDDVDIAANDSRCVIDNRVVAHDASRAVIRERVVVHQSVNSGSIATTIRGMLIGESASIRAIPELDIATNMVSAKHAVSIARPSALALAYCASRGIDRENAMTMIADGLLCPAGSMTDTKL
ncbi:MAG: SufD family Fe-S cluster assembly protein [Patescibacteria group bacterium]